MSFINANTANPTNSSQIGYTIQTQPFTSGSYNSSTIYYIYDTYVIPKGMWLITASVLLTNNTTNSLSTTNVRIAFPGNTYGKNVITNAVSSGSSGYVGLSSYVGEPYYSDGTNSCGIYFNAVTSDSNPYNLAGGTNSTMTYVKIA